MLSLANDNPYREEIQQAEVRLKESKNDSLKRKELTDSITIAKLNAQLWEANQPYYRGNDLSNVAPLDYRMLRREQQRDK